MVDLAVSKKVKTMFELISKDITCNFCQEIIWKAQIFESTGGLTACETCKNSSQEEFQRNYKAEKMLVIFEIECKYKVDGCQITRGPHNIIQHEESCEFRLVTCPIHSKCKEYQFRKSLEHFKRHNMSELIVKDNETCIKIPIKKSYFQFNWHTTDYIYTINGKNFFIQMSLDDLKESVLMWIYLVGSKFEANEFIYRLEVKSPVSKTIYEGPVRYIDEKREDIKKSQMGLFVPYSIVRSFKKNDQSDTLFETKFTIKSLKSKGEIPFESENCETKEPMKKKIKI